MYKTDVISIGHFQNKTRNIFKKYIRLHSNCGIVLYALLFVTLVNLKTNCEDICVPVWRVCYIY